MHQRPSARYAPLPAFDENVELEGAEIGQRRPLLFLLVACVLGLVLCWINASILAYRDPFGDYATTSTGTWLRRGNVYMGLNNVHWDQELCRTRPYTYPTSYSVVDGDDVTSMSRVHAHRDSVMFEFGGKRSAIISFYIPDYGMENCTITFRSILPNASLPHLDGMDGFFDSTTSLDVGPTSALDVYLLQSRTSLVNRWPIGRLPLDGLGADGSVSTVPFWCPSQTNVHLQVACPGACSLRFGLQGMTTATSIYGFVNKTGFVITQYEHLSCL